MIPVRPPKAGGVNAAKWRLSLGSHYEGGITYVLYLKVPVVFDS